MGSPEPPAMDPHAILGEIARLRARVEELHASLSRQALDEVIAAEGREGDVVVCRVGSERYALPLALVERAEMMCALVPFPEAPPWVPGLLNLHGTLVPVLDLAARLVREAREADPSDLILVCRGSGGLVGLVVREVLNVVRLRSEAVKPVPAALPQAPYVLGFVEGEGTPVFLLGLAYLVSQSEIPTART